LTTSFFVHAAELDEEKRWYRFFSLAYRGTGFTLNLNNLPDHVVEWLMTWTKEADEEMEKRAKARG
jgi:hypothetical protein